MPKAAVAAARVSSNSSSIMTWHARSIIHIKNKVCVCVCVCFIVPLDCQGMNASFGYNSLPHHVVVLQPKHEGCREKLEQNEDA